MMSYRRPFEEGFQTLFSIRAFEDIVLFDLHHGKPASIGIYAVVVLCEFLFIRQKYLSRGEPLRSRSDWRMWDCLCLSSMVSPLKEFVVPPLGGSLYPVSLRSLCYKLPPKGRTTNSSSFWTSSQTT
jgi:hypothetical protein